MSTRQHECHDGKVITQRDFVFDSGTEVWAPEKCCLFCDKCTDVWYDSHGPYMYSCEDDPEGKFELTDKGYSGECDHFVEDKDVDANNERIRKNKADIEEATRTLQDLGFYDELLKSMQKLIDNALFNGKDDVSWLINRKGK